MARRPVQEGPDGAFVFSESDLCIHTWRPTSYAERRIAAVFSNIPLPSHRRRPAMRRGVSQAGSCQST